MGPSQYWCFETHFTQIYYYASYSVAVHTAVISCSLRFVFHYKENYMQWNFHHPQSVLEIAPSQLSLLSHGTNCLIPSTIRSATKIHSFKSLLSPPQYYFHCCFLLSLVCFLFSLYVWVNIVLYDTL